MITICYKWIKSKVISSYTNWTISFLKINCVWLPFVYPVLEFSPIASQFATQKVGNCDSSLEQKCDLDFCTPNQVNILNHRWTWKLHLNLKDLRLNFWSEGRFAPQEKIENSRIAFTTLMYQSKCGHTGLINWWHVLISFQISHHHWSGGETPVHSAEKEPERTTHTVHPKWQCSEGIAAESSLSIGLWAKV